MTALECESCRGSRVRGDGMCGACLTVKFSDIMRDADTRIISAESLDGHCATWTFYHPPFDWYDPHPNIVAANARECLF